MIETHSALLLLALQTAIAEGTALNKNDVILHWFTRDQQGFTEVSSTRVDDDGSFGDWPEDFSETLLDQQSAFLDASERRHG